MARPVLLHIPHSSTEVPLEWRPSFQLDEEELKAELRVMTDAYTDDLFDLEGAADRLVFPVSRLLVDVERFHNDRDEPMSEKGMGAVYVKTHDGRPLKSAEHRSQLMSEYYIPHHDALERWATEALEEHGRCLILDCHSFPAIPLPCDLNQASERPGICIGTAGIHSGRGLVAEAKSIFEDQGWTVKIDAPYFGTMVPLPFFGRERRLASIMVEVNRGLYMDEVSGTKLDRYDAIKLGLNSALASIVDVWLRHGNV